MYILAKKRIQWSMDRIYYFMLAKDMGKGKKRQELPRALPVFQKAFEGYEVFYLQVYEDAKKKDLSAIKSCMEKGIGRIASWYTEEEMFTAYMVYDPVFEMWLKKTKMEEYWKNLWDIPIYREYKESHNLKLLLSQIPPNHLPRYLLILGDAPGIHTWIDSLSKYMKMIQFFDLTIPRGFHILREKLLEDYGLIIKWENSLHIKAKEPALILDYCDKDKVFIWDVAPGSIWIDMTSQENHRRGIEERDTGIYYMSLKRFWYKEMQQTLDTANKIQYNTEVN